MPKKQKNDHIRGLRSAAGRVNSSRYQGILAGFVAGIKCRGGGSGVYHAKSHRIFGIAAFLTSQHQGQATIVARPDHTISRSDIDKAALKVLYRLKDAGYQAFLVGGAVRDLLLGLAPKDFDIATDAAPEDVHALFRNSRLIGRRFRLVHVRFGREIIEVATFRASADEHDAADAQQLDAEGRILRDNVYGSIDEDVWRRDFGANALYYNIADFSVWDYVEGLRDVRERRLRLIGDPETRLREDPVRMLRAVRFAAKLDFTIDDDCANVIPKLKEKLADVPAARLFDEFLKLFQAGSAARAFTLLREFDLFGVLFPDTEHALIADESGQFLAFVEAALQNTDRRVAEGKSITPMFLLGVFLWRPIVARAAAIAEEESLSQGQALGLASQEVVLRQQSRISIPKRFSLPMREMLVMQPRFDTVKGRRALSLLEHRRFRAAYDFYHLRASVDDADDELASFWTDIQLVPEAERAERFGVSKTSSKKKSRRPRRRRKRSKSD